MSAFSMIQSMTATLLDRRRSALFLSIIMASCLVLSTAQSSTVDSSTGVTTATGTGSDTGATTATGTGALSQCGNVTYYITGTSTTDQCDNCTVECQWLVGNSTGPVNTISSSSTGGQSEIDRRWAYTNYTIVPQPRVEDHTYCNFTSRKAVSKYDVVELCMAFGGTKKMIYYSTVDDYSLLEVAVNGSYTETLDHIDMWFQLEFANKVSSTKRRRYFDGSNLDQNVLTDIIVPFWTAIINLKDGIVTEIIWDDGCYGCASDYCIEQTCGINHNKCRAQGGSSNCDLKVYLAWFGTDKNGRYLTSAGKRLSRFRNYSVNFAFNTAVDVAEGAAPDPPVFSGQLANENLAPEGASVGDG